MLSPGVQIQEMDFSDYVTSASTSIFGIVGGARKGPTEPTLVTTQSDFVRIFGEPTLSDYGAHSALAVLANADKVYYQRALFKGEKPTGTVGKLVFTAITPGEDYNGTTVEVSTTDDTDYTVTVTTTEGITETFTGNLVGDSNEYLLDLINNQSNLVNVSETEGDMTAGTATLEGGTIGATVGESNVEGDIVFRTKTYDSTLNGARVSLSKADSFGYFNYELLLNGRVLESFHSLSTNREDDRFVEDFINDNSNHLNVTIKNIEGDITDTNYEIQNGTDGIDGISTDDIILGAEQAFSNVDISDIDVLLTPGWFDRGVILACTELAEQRGDCLYIFDPPRGMTAQQVTEWANATGQFATEEHAFNSSYSATYFPWVKVRDNYSRSDIWLPPSGYVASQIAYSDKESEPWFAPAGLNRGRLSRPIALEYSPTKGERDILYGNQNVVNPIINYKSQGLVVWGQKTTQRRPTATNRVNVRRLVNYLKKVITASTAYFVFEPNDEYSWERWYEMIDPSLSAVKSQRGISDYVIEMGRNNITQDDEYNHRMPGVIKVKPTKTAEFVPLEFMIMPSGASFDEIE